MSTQPFFWGGEHRFTINGSSLHEDTLRVKHSLRQSEQMLTLVLPTLCITYADMKFQNDVGGMQENYPASRAYGPTFFTPPVVLMGDDIGKFTYIRGAHRVEIGPDETIIEFPCWKELVIPRLRIDPEPGADALLVVKDTHIDKEQPLTITVKQYADGRHVGGIALEKRHPEYVPPEVKPVYDLWVRVFEGETGKPIPEARVDVWRWDPKAGTPYGPGDFVLDGRHYTDGNGVAQAQNLPAQGVQWYTVGMQGWRVMPRCLRPLPGQPVRLHMRAWKLREDSCRYTWQERDSLDELAALGPASAGKILLMNRIRSADDIAPGTEITLPCYQGTYRPESWEKLADIAARFGYEGTKELAAANGLRDIKAYRGTVDLKLPQWRFFTARAGDSLAGFDRQFGLPPGSTVAAHRLYRPRAGALLPEEVVAVPTAQFADVLAGRRRPT